MIQGKEYQALIDTGASDCYVSEDVVKINKLTEIVVKGQKIKFRNDTEGITQKQVNILFIFKGSEGKQNKYTEAFYVLSKLSHPIILGNSFLKSNKAIINMPLNSSV